jgi:FkbM family methyltransferase
VSGYKKLFDLLKQSIFNRKRAKFSFSQAGEDVVLQRYFLSKKEGFYVDIGAYHPYLLSNTYLFYLQGWNGINIEPRRGSKQLFDKYRPRDINLEMGVFDTVGIYPFYEDCEATNSRFEFSDNTVLLNKQEEYSVPTEKLANIFKNFVPKGTNIDFLSIDTEGAEFLILKSNNWTEYRPHVILVEQNFNSSSFKKFNELLLKEGYKEGYRIPVNEFADSVFFIIK